MKIKRAPSKKTWLFVGAAILIIGSIGVGVYALNRSKQSNQTTDSSASISPEPVPEGVNDNNATDDEIKAGSDAKSETVNPSVSPEASNGLTITAFYTGASVQIRSTISASVSDGSCKLVLVKDSSTVTRDSVGIQPLSDYSTCKGWDIPVSELSSGKWTVKVTAMYQSKTASASADVTIP